MKNLILLFALLIPTLVFADLITVDTGPKKPTTAMLQAKTASNIRNILSIQYRRNVDSYNQVYGLIWKNPDGLTPQQAFDGLKKDAVSLLQIGVGMANYVNSIIPNSVPADGPSQYSVNPNPDGTVTVTSVQVSTNTDTTTNTDVTTNVVTNSGS